MFDSILESITVLPTPRQNYKIGLLWTLVLCWEKRCSDLLKLGYYLWNNIVCYKMFSCLRCDFFSDIILNLRIVGVATVSVVIARRQQHFQDNLNHTQNSVVKWMLLWCGHFQTFWISVSCLINDCDDHFSDIYVSWSMLWPDRGNGHQSIWES